ncbi:glutaredoxin 3 [Temperatibacter marinus]|uniref:Glutaredoxin n=1 Tax=Temperatibacter marinus TaxID=1456591 RepID=A0AA52H966_9PROT|nr:glutaredoxin 3 [Temperatibacter marinus]WND01370.1 glutaredoxin 3 [Temperatibacter marinus]
MKDVLIYSSSLCPYCYRAKALLNSKNVPYKEINVDMNPTARAEMRSKASGRNTVPQIFIGGEHIGGCDDLYSLESQGDLTPMLAIAS